MEVQTLFSRNNEGATTAFNTGALRAMTQPALLTSRNQFDSLSLNEQVSVWVLLVDSMNNAKSLDVLIFADCVCCVQNDDDSDLGLWQELGAFEAYEQLRLQIQLIIWLSFVHGVTQSTLLEQN